MTAHTPVIGASEKLMNVTHTPLIGRDGNIFECSASITVQSRAGFNVISKTVQNVHGDIDTDCRKHDESHGSPDDDKWPSGTVWGYF